VHEQLGTAQTGGSVRIGIGPFNTEQHIKTAIEAIGEIVDFQRQKLTQ
jgi:cysteine sulfinate desulfinase/cysteine desulfurase-like protein